MKPSRRIGMGIILLLSVAILGCGARGEVAKEKLLKKLDSMLGTLDVQRKEIEISMKGLNDGIAGIRKAKIKAQVKLEQLDEKTQPSQDRIAQCDKTLANLRDMLKADQPAEIAGKTYQPAELKSMADKVIQERKKAETQIAGFKKSQDALKKVITDLEKKQSEYEAHQTRLQGQLATLDAELVAAKALKDASASMGDGDATLADNINKLEDKIAALKGDVRAELLTEDQKWSETATMKRINDVDTVIAATQGSGDTLAEIDRILGGKK
jgi:chromosome segregation ATPase